MASKNELQAISLKSEINANHRECLKTANDAIDYALKAGELLLDVKGLVPHGEFQNWVKQYCEFNYDVAKGYMRLNRDLLEYSKKERAHLLADATSIGNLKKLLKPAENSNSTPEIPPPSGFPDSDFDGEVSSEWPVEDEGPTGPPPPGKKGKPVDLGKCPNCAGERWKEDEDGWECAKCHHPHGEPAGDVDGDRVKIQRQKTVKTVEALMRAFDDLQLLVPKEVHEATITCCKGLLATAKGWK